jgi:hypothetical protein
MKSVIALTAGTGRARRKHFNPTGSTGSLKNFALDFGPDRHDRRRIRLRRCRQSRGWSATWHPAFPAIIRTGRRRARHDAAAQATE